MRIETACILVFICVLLCAVVRKYKSEYAVLLSAAIGLVLVFESIEYISEIFSGMKSIMPEKIEFENETAVLLKALFVSVITQFASDTCLDAGEKALSSRIEFFGKISVLVIAMPLFSSLSKLVFEILGA